jgi:alpha-glucosidase (family GH31 glycosyl hydrolase)
MYESGEAVMRPLFFEFPDDSNTWTLATQWMVGPSLMAAPVLSQDNTTQVYLPAATWYEYGTSASHQGPTTLSLQNVCVTCVPAYVRAGGILALAPATIQYTDQLPGGALNIQV